MNPMKRKAALRIAMVTLTMAALASPLAWYVSRQNAEEAVVAFAKEEVRRVVEHAQALRLDGPEAGACWHRVQRGGKKICCRKWDSH